MIKSIVTFSFFALSMSSMAGSLNFKGTGLDGKECNVDLEHSNERLSSLSIKGAAKVFGGVDHELNPVEPSVFTGAASNMISFLDPRNPERREYILSLAKFTKKKKTESISIDFSDLPENEINQHDLMSCNYSKKELILNIERDGDGKVISVEAKTKEKLSPGIFARRKVSYLFKCQ